MRPPVKKALVRVVLFVVFGCLGGPLFWAIEHRGDQRAMKAALLQSLNASMSAKYNMTAQDFENFTRISFEALRPSTASWTLEEAVEFSFQTITTIGKKIFWRHYLDSGVFPIFLSDTTTILFSPSPLYFVVWRLSNRQDTATSLLLPRWARPPAFSSVSSAFPWRYSPWSRLASWSRKAWWN